MRTIITLISFLLTSCGKGQPALPINNGSPSIGINVPGQSPLPVVNYPQVYFSPQSGDITFTNSHFQYSVNGVAETGFTRRSPGGFVRFRTSETSMDIKVGGNWSTALSPFDNQSAIEVFVNNVWNQSVTLTADNTTQTIPITLPAGQKIVELRNGYTANPDGSDVTIPLNGVYVQGVVTTGDIEIEIPIQPDNLFLVVGNSIATGASGTHPLVNGWPMLLRAEGWQVQLDSWGARRLLTFNVGDAFLMAAYIDDQMVAENNTLLMMLGTNNWGLSGGQSKAVFKTEYQNFIDALHSVRPDIRIVCVSPLVRTGQDTPNSQGAILDDYKDAILELIADGRSWAEFIDGETLVSIGNLPDGLHPNDTGHAEIKTNIKAAIEAL